MLKPQYRFAPISIVVGEEPVCANRKVAKLIRMAAKAERADLFVISDADISVERDYLRRIAGELYSDDSIGVVTCLYRARPHEGISSRLEALSINTDFAPMVMLSAIIEPIRYALGATMAIRRAALETIGGFRAIKDMLADDFFLGGWPQIRDGKCGCRVHWSRWCPTSAASRISGTGKFAGRAPIARRVRPVSLRLSRTVRSGRFC